MPSQDSGAGCAHVRSSSPLPTVPLLIEVGSILLLLPSSSDELRSRPGLVELVPEIILDENPLL